MSKSSEGGNLHRNKKSQRYRFSEGETKRKKGEMKNEKQRGEKERQRGKKGGTKRKK